MPRCNTGSNMAPSKEGVTEDGKRIMRWDDSADRQLFLACLVSHDLKLDPEKLANSLGCTVRAVQERLKHLKKVAMKEADVGSRPAAARAAATKPAVSTPEPSTPRQKKRGPKPRSQAHHEGTADEAMGNVENGGSVETPHPVKKRKMVGEGALAKPSMDDEEAEVAKM
ncbi:MAG: hypothetical protein Q9163_005211 [Psora crenata]